MTRHAVVFGPTAHSQTFTPPPCPSRDSITVKWLGCDAPCKAVPVPCLSPTGMTCTCRGESVGYCSTRHWIYKIPQNIEVPPTHHGDLRASHCHRFLCRTSRSRPIMHNLGFLGRGDILCYLISVRTDSARAKRLAVITVNAIVQT